MLYLDMYMCMYNTIYVEYNFSKFFSTLFALIVYKFPFQISDDCLQVFHLTHSVVHIDIYVHTYSRYICSIYKELISVFSIINCCFIKYSESLRFQPKVCLYKERSHKD